MPRPDDVGIGVGILFIRNDEILLLKRQGAHYEGYWAMPGGWIDREDNDGATTCKKEAMEELGLNLHTVVQRGTLFRQNDDLGILNPTLYYRALRWSGIPEIREPEKCSEIRWVPISEVLAGGMLTFPDLQEAILKEIHGGWHEHQEV